MILRSGALAVLVPAVAGLALLLWPDRPACVGRTGPRRWGLPGRWRTAVSAIGAAAALTLAVPRWWWVGLLLAVAIGVLHDGLPARVPAARRIALRAELAGRLDLIGACLRSGMATPAALSAVADACDGERRDGRVHTHPLPPPVGAGDAGAVLVLAEVRSLLAVGADPVTAWRPALGHPELSTVAAAACRSSAAGTALADAFTEQAALLRSVNAEAVVRSAGRAGVLMTAPLGACFLPAFLCLGLAPAIVGLLGSLSLW